MEAVAVLVGVVVIFITLLDAFEALVLPRRITRLLRPARLYYRSGWRVWQLLARGLPAGKRRDSFLSVFGPLSILLLFVCWMATLIVAFGLIHWGLKTPLSGLTDAAPPTLLDYLYLSGETIFTLGYGDLTAARPLGRFLLVAEAGLGFGFLAVVIAYLPVLYSAFSRREAVISLLDARAGSPPSAAELLLRLGGAADPHATGQALLAEWERWSAELLESHLSFPVLSYYRSQHDNQSWLAALTVMLDTCAFVLSSLQDADPYQAQMTFAMARHAAVDLALSLHTPPHNGVERLPKVQLDWLREQLRARGLAVRGDPAADAKLAELRRLYEPFVQALAEFLLLRLPEIVPEKPAVDNWQTSAWMRRAAGIQKLRPSDPYDDHFD